MTKEEIELLAGGITDYNVKFSPDCDELTITLTARNYHQHVTAEEFAASKAIRVEFANDKKLYELLSDIASYYTTGKIEDK